MSKESQSELVYSSLSHNLRREMMNIFEADEIASYAHRGQVDKLGVDYINHPRAVAKLVTTVPSYKLLNSMERDLVQCAALLHDVIEDTNLEATDLYELGVSANVLDVVKKLTRDDAKSPEEYYSRIDEDRYAYIVKVADILHNTDPKRVVKLPEETGERLRRKYWKAIQLVCKSHPVELEWFNSMRNLSQ